MFYLIILVVLTIVLLFFIVFWFIQLNLNSHSDTIGLLPSLSKKLNKGLIDYINEYASDTENYNFVELGAGTANITNFLSSQFKFKSVTAVELEFITINLAKFLNLFSKNKIQFIRKNIFNYNLPPKSIVYCYLGNTIVTKYYNQGGFKGALVLSTTFQIEGVEPTKILDLPGTFYQKLYLYDFR